MIKPAVLLLAAALTTGCAPMTVADREARAYEWGEFRNQFIEDRARCRADGRRLVVRGPGGSLDRNGIPKTRVWYTCT